MNDISFAEKSVDERMRKEMDAGRAVIAGSGVDIRAVTDVNLGGPYGSEVLKGVKEDSERVWEEVSTGKKGDVGKGWYLAPIYITARDEAEGGWTARGGESGKEHKFVRS